MGILLWQVVNEKLLSGLLAPYIVRSLLVVSKGFCLWKLPWEVPNFATNGELSVMLEERERESIVLPLFCFSLPPFLLIV